MGVWCRSCTSHCIDRTAASRVNHALHDCIVATFKLHFLALCAKIPNMNHTSRDNFVRKLQVYACSSSAPNPPFLLSSPRTPHRTWINYFRTALIQLVLLILIRVILVLLLYHPVTMKHAHYCTTVLYDKLPKARPHAQLKIAIKPRCALYRLHCTYRPQPPWTCASTSRRQASLPPIA